MREYSYLILDNARILMRNTNDLLPCHFSYTYVTTIEVEPAKLVMAPRPPLIPLMLSTLSEHLLDEPLLGVAFGEHPAVALADLFDGAVLELVDPQGDGARLGRLLGRHLARLVTKGPQRACLPIDLREHLKRSDRVGSNGALQEFGGVVDEECRPPLDRLRLAGVLLPLPPGDPRERHLAREHRAVVGAQLAKCPHDCIREHGALNLCDEPHECDGADAGGRRRVQPLSLPDALEVLLKVFLRLQTDLGALFF